MIVCAHGEVSEYCESRDMVIVERFTGEIENYWGRCAVLVTDREMSASEYYFLKGRMLSRGVELVSTRFVDAENLPQGMVRDVSEKRRGRRKFGDGSDAEMAVVNRIFELRDAGRTLKEISEDEKVCRMDGQKLSISTIQTILNNREKY